ncbi:YceI family protein [Paraburkholderia atlantica]|uniref:YceI family protein n=1 Tax=Paraburkholderia atlantica TaxID=2654982 RepID=D5WI57_PARAM|nr:YceI family protein [Paraburkholderia atlantica]ADG18152.1 YceI family protein [Paraburkholderia atlantica]
MTNPAAWSVDPAHTHIGFSVGHLGLTRTPGVFKRFVARLQFDERNIEASSVTFEVETASIDTALEMRDGHLRGADWFDVEAHPKAVFVSRAVQRGGNDRYVIEGVLSLRGVTLPVMFDAALTGRAVNPWTQAPVVGFEAVATISRSAYGMGAFPGALSDSVRLKIETELTTKNDATQ